MGGSFTPFMPIEEAFTIKSTLSTNSFNLSGVKPVDVTLLRSDRLSVRLNRRASDGVRLMIIIRFTSGANV